MKEKNERKNATLEDTEPRQGGIPVETIEIECDHCGHIFLYDLCTDVINALREGSMIAIKCPVCKKKIYIDLPILSKSEKEKR